MQGISSNKMTFGRRLIPLLLVLYYLNFGESVEYIAKKNVLFVIVDDLRPAIGYYGDGKAVTPHIDDLAAKSATFFNAFAQQALCAPSRNSLLTSRRPDTLHLYDFYSYWRKTVGDFTTLPQYVKTMGYITYSIGKVFHPGKSSNNTDDFPKSWSMPAYHPITDEFTNTPVCIDRSTGLLQKNLICPVTVKSQPFKSLPDIESTDEALRFIDMVKNSTTPFFLAVGYHKPHIPFRFPFKYLNLHPLSKFNDENSIYVPYGLPPVAWNPYSDVRERDDISKLNISFPYGPIPEDYRKLIRQSYYASVSYVDHQLGRLLKNINFDNTIVVLTSDHGWSLGEHAEWAKYSNFEVSTRVPLIIYSPELKPKGIKSIVELIDLFPTIVELAGLPTIKPCQTGKEFTCTEGKSLVPLMKRVNVNGNVNDDQYNAISQYPRPSVRPQWNSDSPHLKRIKIMGYTIRTKQFRYTIWIYFNRKTFKRHWYRIYGEELYDHSFDPGENENLADRPQLNSLRTYLKSLLKHRLR